MNDEHAPKRRDNLDAGSAHALPFRRFSRISVLMLLTAGILNAQWIPPNPVSKVEQRPDGILFTLQTGELRVQVCTDSIIHITYSPVTSFPNLPEYLIVKTAWPAANFTVQDSPQAVTISTDRVRVAVNRADATIAYSELGGRRLVH